MSRVGINYPRDPQKLKEFLDNALTGLENFGILALYLVKGIEPKDKEGLLKWISSMGHGLENQVVSLVDILKKMGENVDGLEITYPEQVDQI